MNKPVKNLTALTLLLSLCPGAYALMSLRSNTLYTDSGPYIEALGGVTFDDSSDTTFSTLGQTNNIQTSSDIGYNAGGAIGYKWGPLRVEEAFTKAKNDLDDVTDPQGVKLTDTSGDTDAELFMTNFYFDIPTGTKFIPYIGAGIGLAHVNYQVAGMDATVIAGGVTGNRFPVGYNGSDYTFAYQAIAGVQYAIKRHLLVGIDYRYIGTTKADYVFNSPTYGVPYDIDNRYRTQNIDLNVIYNFG